MLKYSVVALLLGAALAILVVSADDDSYEYNFRTGRWEDSDESDERFGGGYRSFRTTSHNNNWRSPSVLPRRTSLWRRDDSDERRGSRNSWRSSSSVSRRRSNSWRRDDSDESDERWFGESRWATPTTSRNSWKTTTGRPLNTFNNGLWNGHSNRRSSAGQWNRNTQSNSANKWNRNNQRNTAHLTSNSIWNNNNRRNVVSNPWASKQNKWTTKTNKWQNTGNKWQSSANKWKSGRQTFNSGAWKSDNNKNWNRKWW